MATKPQDTGVAADDDSAASIENDLKILADMNIDQDFNAWADFRDSFSVQGRRESLQSFMSSSKSRQSASSIGQSARTRTSITPVVEGVPANNWNASEQSILEEDIADSKHSELTHSDHSGPRLDVSFSTLTPGETRDIRAWNTRLSRETVFSRYYFPEQWELRELKTIEKFLEIEDPSESWFMNEPGLETTKKTITNIFFPGKHDPKSVLLKRGPILLDGTDEREILLFTHGFLLHRMECDTLLNILFTINSENPELLTSSQLEDRFNAIDSDQSGSLDRCELKEVFKGMGVPVSERALTDIMGRFDKDHDGTIDFAEFEDVMLSLKPKTQQKWTFGFLGEQLKRTVTGSNPDYKIECAYPYADIKKVESINMCSSEATAMFVNSSWAELVFAIYVKGKDEPYLMVCSKPEQRQAWVEAFRTCCVNSIFLRANTGSKIAKKIKEQVGWQHILVQDSLFSLVTCNHFTGLKEKLANPPPGMNINDKDEYCGYSPLHYAAILGHTGCADLLLHYKARVNIQDDDEKTPLDHATLSENMDMIKLLEKHGGKRKASDVLFKDAVEEQAKLRSEQSPKSAAKKTMDKAKQATGAMHQAMSAMRERGEKLEKLDNKTSQLNTEAANYAQMAKQMKEKNKKKAAFWGGVRNTV